MDSTAGISTALQSMDVSGANMEDAMQIFIKNHVLSNPITCESTKTKATTEQKEERIKRPMNAFMVFSHQARKMIAKKNPNLKNSDLSKYLGSTWKNFTEEKKAMFKRKAEELRAKHKKDHPQYKYQPRRKKSKVLAAAAAAAAAASSSSIVEKPVRSTASKKAAKLKEYSRLSDSSTSPANSNNDLYIDESASPMSDQASLQASFSYPLQEGIPFDYPCNAYGNNNSTNHNHNMGNSIQVNSSIAAGLVNPGHRRTPCVLTPPSTPINPDLSAMNVSNGLPAHLYAQNAYRANDFASEKCSPMHYTSSPSSSSSNAYPSHHHHHHLHPHNHQTTAVDLHADLYNGYNNACGQPNDYSVDLPAMEMPNVYNVNSYGYESHKFNDDTTNPGYFEDEKKFDVSTGIDGGRNICVPNGYMHYNNC